SREFGSRSVDSIQIEYDQNAIVGVEENIRLVDTLKGISNSSLTVYHDNPYLHASVLDFEDGSTVDVFLTSDEEIALVPGFRTSKRTLSRICEDVVEESQSESRELADYFG
ncbi:MAG: hypothetical protein ABEI86_13030, partial [Halobacteriaceae archaeon]